MHVGTASKTDRRNFYCNDGAQALPIGPIVVPFLGLPYRILNMIPKKELLWGLWVAFP